MKIGIVGSRRRDSIKDYELVEEVFLQLYKPNDTIVSGGCPKGGDRFAEIIAKKYNVSILVHYPKWGVYGISAGFQRNTLIVNDSDILIACVANDRKGGTEDTIKKAKNKKIKIIVV